MRTRTRLRSAKKGHGAQRNILQRRLWFSFSDSGAIVDLGADNPLVIRANVDVREAAGADQIVSHSVWETNRRGISTKRKPPASFVVFRLDIQVDRNGMRVVSISQDPSTFKGKERQRRSKDGWLWEKRLSNGGKDMYLPARVTITDSGGAPLSGGGPAIRPAPAGIRRSAPASVGMYGWKDMGSNRARRMEVAGLNGGRRNPTDYAERHPYRRVRKS